jgi:hypothetical protein
MIAVGFDKDKSKANLERIESTARGLSSSGMTLIFWSSRSDTAKSLDFLSLGGQVSRS